MIVTFVAIFSEMITTFTSLRNGGHFIVKLMAMIISSLTPYYQSMVAFSPLLESTIISSCEIRIIEKIRKEIYTFLNKKMTLMDIIWALISLFCSE